MLSILRAYRNKVTNKLWGVAYVPARGTKKGDVLLSFLTGPFTLAPGERFTDPHSNYWVAAEMARLFAGRGYAVDVINWDNDHFIPRKKYAACVDLHQQLERLAPYLGHACVKVMHLQGSYPEFQNQAFQKRLNALEERRGIKLEIDRYAPPTNDYQHADLFEGYGNATVVHTYPADIAKKITIIPIPTVEEYPVPVHKNYEEARRHFLWFGGGGAVLKGLDLALEAFAQLPDYRLTIIGPASYEKEFERVYAKELELPNITRYGRPQLDATGRSRVGEQYVSDIVAQCGAILGLSASEGGGGATVQAMQAGLIPIVTPNTGIDERAPQFVLTDPTPEGVRKAVEEFAARPPEELERMSREVRAFTLKHHSKQAFSEAYGRYIDETMHL